MSYRYTLLAIYWGPGLANVLTVSTPLDNPVAGDEPRPSCEWIQGASGVEDAWITGVDYTLEGDVRWIPQVDAGGATGWDGATGWRAFLVWARDKNTFTVRRDVSDAGSAVTGCYLVEPTRAIADAEPNGQRRVHLKLRTTSVAWDGY